MADLNGIHIADGQQYHVEQALRAASGSCTILDFLMADSDLRSFGYEGTMYSDVENCRWYGVLRTGRTGQGIPPSTRAIHIRQYHPDWRKIALNMADPTKPTTWTINAPQIRRWAKHCVDRFSNWIGANEHHQLKADLFLDPRVTFSPYNEQDIEPAWIDYMQSKFWYTLIGQSNTIWLDEINRLRPDRKCLTMTSALAGGHEPYGDEVDTEYTIPAMRDMLMQFDIIGAHCYGLLNESKDKGMFGAEAKWYGLRLWRGMTELKYPDCDLALKNAQDPGGLVYQARKLGKKVHISEGGTFMHDKADYADENIRHMTRYWDAASRSQVVTGVDWFIWNSNSVHSGNRIWPSEPLRLKLEKAARYPAAAWPRVGETTTPPVQPPVTTPPPTTTKPPVKPPTVTPPVEEFDPNPYGMNVGPGVLALMKKNKDVAMTDEMFSTHLNSTMSETIAKTGTVYRAWQNKKDPSGDWFVRRYTPTPER